MHKKIISLDLPNRPTIWNGESTELLPISVWLADGSIHILPQRPCHGSRTRTSTTWGAQSTRCTHICRLLEKHKWQEQKLRTMVSGRAPSQGVEFTEISWWTGGLCVSCWEGVTSLWTVFRALVNCENEGRRFGSLAIDKPHISVHLASKAKFRLPWQKHETFYDFLSENILIF